LGHAVNLVTDVSFPASSEQGRKGERIEAVLVLVLVLVELVLRVVLDLD